MWKAQTQTPILEGPEMQLPGRAAACRCCPAPTRGSRREQPTPGGGGLLLLTLTQWRETFLLLQTAITPSQTRISRSNWMLPLRSGNWVSLEPGLPERWKSPQSRKLVEFSNRKAEAVEGLRITRTHQMFVCMCYYKFQQCFLSVWMGTPPIYTHTPVYSRLLTSSCDLGEVISGVLKELFKANMMEGKR